MIDLILQYLPYYIMIGFIFSLSITIIIRPGTRLGRSILLIQVAIIIWWLPLIFIAFGMLINNYITGREKAGDDS